MNISERASELRRLRAEATPGYEDWRVEPTRPDPWPSLIVVEPGRAQLGVIFANYDADFIVAAANSVDELARFCEEAWALLSGMKQSHESLLLLKRKDPERDPQWLDTALAVTSGAVHLLARYSSEPAPKENP